MGFHVWNLRDDFQQYDQYIIRCVNVTPFHLTEYLLAEAWAENGDTKIFCYEEDGDFALIPEVIRKINDLPYMADLNEELYDMIAPHEYGGIVSNSYDNVLKHKLLKEISEYCNKNNIIYQFIRINPYLKELPSIYRDNGFDVIYSNAQVYVDLRNTEEQIRKEYKADVRYGIRRAEREGLKFCIADKNQDNINFFREGYQKAMDFLKARKFLYFNKAYFTKLLECDCSNLAVVTNKEGTMIAASIVLVANRMAYYHLSWFDRSYSSKCPMNYLLHSMILWAKENRCEIMHLAGGGKSLMKFKGGYSDTRIDYYIANQICDKKKYHIVCEKWRERFPEYIDENYYPLYRYNE